MENSNETIDVASTMSQVNNEKNMNGKGKAAIWLVIGALAVFIIIAFLPSRHEKAAEPATPQVTQKENHTQEMQANMATLHKDSVVTKPQETAFQAPAETTPVSSELLARQNAPTSMYSATITQSAAAADSTGNNASRTFAGHSAFDQFGNQNTVSASVSAQRVEHPQYSIVSGEFMHAVLETAINSDLPGMVRAIISKPVYGYTGETPLIPAGSRLIGQYSSTVLQGQNRVFVIWNRVILPNGVSAELNSPGVDPLGVAGQGADSVNTHFFARFGQASLLSIIGAGVANYGVHPQDQYNSSASYRAAMSQSFQQSAQQSLQNSIQMQPTITINQGAEINVFVSRDIDFYSVLAQARTA